MIQTIYFDLGNVIVFFSHQKMIRQIAETAGLSPQEVQSMLITNRGQIEHERGKVKTEELYAEFSRRGTRPFTFHEFIEAASDIFTPNTELFPIIEELKKRGIRLILLSNTSECHYNRVYSHYPILRLFDAHVLSYEAGACKPDPLIFRKALTLAECPKSNCFYIDDIPEYVTAARKTGLDSEIFTNVEALKKQLAARKIHIP